MTREVFQAEGVTLYCADAMKLMPTLTGIDCVIADPPYSARTHDGHGSGAEAANRVTGEGYPCQRSKITYAAWSEIEVKAICAMLPPVGWACFLTSHDLARDWERELQAMGRYVFAPLPVVTTGRSVRLCGDGPSSWTDWLVVARTKAERKWGTLPGYYQGSAGQIEHMGGKPVDAMCRIVQDYSREGATVLDFCMGAATTGIACIRNGRKFVGIEKDPAHFATAVERISRELAQGDLFLRRNETKLKTAALI